MVNIATHINTFQSKLQLLLKQYAKLQKNNAQQVKQIEQQQQQIVALEKTIQQQQQQIASLQLKQSALSEEDKKALEKRINVYLKEIEQCLALLNN